MGFLIALLLACAPAHAASAPIPEAFEISPSAGIGQGRTYSWSLGGALHYPMGSFQAGYTNQLAPLDATDPDPAIRHIDNWNGGVFVSPWKDGSISVELDVTKDPMLSLSSSGVRVSVGHRPFYVGYRLARTRLDRDFRLFRLSQGLPVPIGFRGAITYQHQLEVGAGFEVGKADSFNTSLRRSYFTPQPESYSRLLDLPILFPLLNLQSSLENFEMWNLAMGWRHEIDSVFDSTVSLAFTRLVLNAIPVWDGGADFGIQLSQMIRGRVAFNRSKTEGFDQTMFSLGFSLTWQKPLETSEKSLGTLFDE